MLYLILPPIIIVVGLGALVVIFLKKTASLSERERKILESEETGDLGKESVWKKINRVVFSVFSEKTAQWFKVIFLKAHNASDRWFRSVREKKQSNGSGVSKEGGKKGEIAGKKRIILLTSKKKTELLDAEKEEKYVMISKKAVNPQSWTGSEVASDKMEEKNELEKVLIERIASNPKDVEAYERLGDYYDEQKNYGDALECFRQVLKLSPFNRKAKIKTRRLKKILPP